MLAMPHLTQTYHFNLLSLYTKPRAEPIRKASPDPLTGNRNTQAKRQSEGGRLWEGKQTII